jgi:DNA mismatch repair protein MutL
MTIRAMEPGLIAQIKAGEVIERPFSVVKELLENALDAQPRRIRVEIEEGGTKLIRVIDNGGGIAPDELALAFAEHTTSKLASESALERIETLGFRGEALHTIASVARVEAISGLPGSEAARVIHFDNGALIDEGPAAPAGGTRITVSELFAQVPARRKYLRSARAETSAIHQIVGQYALAHPGVAVSLYADSRMVISTPGTGDIADAFSAVYGADLLGRMVPLDTPGSVAVSGLISRPELSRPNRTAINLLVNGRPVRSPALMFAIEDAYAGLLMVGRHPLAAIRLAVPPEQIDPNVHPAKLEIRFLNERPVFSALRGAVATALDGGVAMETGFRPLQDRTLQPGANPQAELWPPASPRPPYPPDLRFDSPAPPTASPKPNSALPQLRVFGQTNQTFIVAEGPTGVYMIDQHAAHERVIFDALTDRPGALPAQAMLDPAMLELTEEQAIVLEKHQQQLNDLGFQVEAFGDRTCRVHSIPAIGRRTVTADAVVEVLDAIEGARDPNQILNQVFTVVACKAAVKAGDEMSMEEMDALVRDLAATRNPRTCPHGRPTAIHISTERLEREFGRR